MNNYYNSFSTQEVEAEHSGNKKFARASGREKEAEMSFKAIEAEFTA